MMSKISKSPTISVSPPQTPIPSDPFRYSLPMSDDSKRIIDLERKNAELETKNAELETKNAELQRKYADLQKETDNLKKTFKAKLDKQNAKIKAVLKTNKAQDAKIKKQDAKIKKQDAKIKKQDAKIKAVLKTNKKLVKDRKNQDVKIERLVKDRDEQARIVEDLTRPDIFDKLVDDLNSQGVQSLVENINSYDNEDTISEKVIHVVASNAEERLDTLATYLKAKSDPRLEDLFFDLFSQLKPFALKKVISADKKPSGTTNKFLKKHFLETSEEYSTRVEPSFALFEAFVRTHHPKFVHFLPLLLSNYEIYDQEGESRASKMVSDKLDHAVEFINRNREPSYKLSVREQFSIGDNRVDFAVLKLMDGVLFIETKETLGIQPDDLDGMESLPKSLDPVLRQGFGYSLMKGIRKVIVTDGIVYIQIDIS